jgi:hypothetical protein
MTEHLGGPESELLALADWWLARSHRVDLVGGSAGELAGDLLGHVDLGVDVQLVGEDPVAIREERRVTAR